LGINKLNLENMKTLIKANKDLYNHGKCFTEGKTYEVTGNVKCEAALMERCIINDMGEDHIIGSFWRDFSIITIEN
jgi:hypothetical protein